MVRLRETVREDRLGTIVGVLWEQSALHKLHLTADAWRWQEYDRRGSEKNVVEAVRQIRDVLCRAAQLNLRRYLMACVEIEHGIAGQRLCQICLVAEQVLAGLRPR
jgi:hypothetical protein